MRFASILLASLLAVSLSGNSYSDETVQDVAQIKDIIQTAYVEGLQNEGDPKKIDQGFHPDFNLLGIGKDGAMWAYPISEWKEDTARQLQEGKLPRTGDKLVTIKFLSVDVTGTAAVAKFEFYVGKELKYVDYLSLYKFGDDWKIVSKIFYQFEN